MSDRSERRRPRASGPLLMVVALRHTPPWMIAVRRARLLVAAAAHARNPGRLPPRHSTAASPARRRHLAAFLLSPRDRHRPRFGDGDPVQASSPCRRARRRGRAHRRPRESAASRAALLRGEPSFRNRLAAHRGHRVDRDRRRQRGLGGAAQQRDGSRRHRLSIHPVARAHRPAPARHPADHRTDRLPRTTRPPDLAIRPRTGSRTSARLPRRRSAR